MNAQGKRTDDRLSDASSSTRALTTARSVSAPVQVSHYKLGKEIGRGGFGVVFEALDQRSGRTTAVKRIPLHGLASTELVTVKSEISLLQKLVHPNIVRYVDSVTTREHLYIILEWIESGSLAQVLKRFGPLSEHLSATLISQALAGLVYLHEQGVIHRDIKGGNLLIDKNGVVKLTDFGVASLGERSRGSTGGTLGLPGGKAGKQAVGSGREAGKAGKHRDASPDVAGSPYWMAPEVIELAGAVPASDIWSLGATVLELVTGKPPYFDLSPLSAMFHIVQDEGPPIPGDTISPVLRDFLGRCFRKQPELRSTAAELLTHPWITNALAYAAALNAEADTSTGVAPVGESSSRRRSSPASKGSNVQTGGTSGMQQSTSQGAVGGSSKTATGLGGHPSHRQVSTAGSALLGHVDDSDEEDAAWMDLVAAEERMVGTAANGPAGTGRQSRGQRLGSTSTTTSGTGTSAAAAGSSAAKGDTSMGLPVGLSERSAHAPHAVQGSQEVSTSSGSLCVPFDRAGRGSVDLSSAGPTYAQPGATAGTRWTGAAGHSSMSSKEAGLARLTEAVAGSNVRLGLAPSPSSMPAPAVTSRLQTGGGRSMGGGHEQHGPGQTTTKYGWSPITEVSEGAATVTGGGTEKEGSYSSGPAGSSGGGGGSQRDRSRLPPMTSASVSAASASSTAGSAEALAAGLAGALQTGNLVATRAGRRTSRAVSPVHGGGHPTMGTEGVAGLGAVTKASATGLAAKLAAWAEEDEEASPGGRTDAPSTAFGEAPAAGLALSSSTGPSKPARPPLAPAAWPIPASSAPAGAPSLRPASITSSRPFSSPIPGHEGKLAAPSPPASALLARNAEEDEEVAGNELQWGNPGSAQPRSSFEPGPVSTLTPPLIPAHDTATFQSPLVLSVPATGRGAPLQHQVAGTPMVSIGGALTIAPGVHTGTTSSAGQGFVDLRQPTDMSTPAGTSIGLGLGVAAVESFGGSAEGSSPTSGMLSSTVTDDVPIQLLSLDGSALRQRLASRFTGATPTGALTARVSQSIMRDLRTPAAAAAGQQLGTSGTPTAYTTTSGKGGPLSAPFLARSVSLTSTGTEAEALASAHAQQQVSRSVATPASSNRSVAASGTQPPMLNTRLGGTTGHTTDSEQDDPFSTFEPEDFRKDLRAEERRLKEKSLLSLAAQLDVSVLMKGGVHAWAGGSAARVQAAGGAFRPTVQKILRIFKEDPSLRSWLVAQHAISPIIDALHASSDKPYIAAWLLRLLNGLAGDTGTHHHPMADAIHALGGQGAALLSPGQGLPLVDGAHGAGESKSRALSPLDRAVREAMALIGTLPPVLAYAAPNYPTTVRMQAATYALRMLGGGHICRQVFVAVGGVRMLVQLLYGSPRPAELVMSQAKGSGTHSATPSPAEEPDGAVPAQKPGDVSSTPHGADAVVAVEEGDTLSSLAMHWEQAEASLQKAAVSAIREVLAMASSSTDAASATPITTNELRRLFLRAGVSHALTVVLHRSFVEVCTIAVSLSNQSSMSPTDTFGQTATVANTRSTVRLPTPPITPPQDMSLPVPFVSGGMGHSDQRRASSRSKAAEQYRAEGGRVDDGAESSSTSNTASMPSWRGKTRHLGSLSFSTVGSAVDPEEWHGATGSTVQGGGGALSASDSTSSTVSTQIAGASRASSAGIHPRLAALQAQAQPLQNQHSRTSSSASSEEWSGAFRPLPSHSTISHTASSSDRVLSVSTGVSGDGGEQPSSVLDGDGETKARAAHSAAASTLTGTTQSSGDNPAETKPFFAPPPESVNDGSQQSLKPTLAAVLQRGSSPISGAATHATGCLPSPMPKQLADACTGLARLAELVLTFSQGDGAVKAGVATRDLCGALLRVLRPAPFALLGEEKYAVSAVRALRALRWLSLEPSVAEPLASANAVPLLVGFLAREVLGQRTPSPTVAPLPTGSAHHGTGAPSLCSSSRPPVIVLSEHTPEVLSSVIGALFNLCRVNRARQADAAAAGIVPPLMVLSGVALPFGFGSCSNSRAKPTNAGSQAAPVVTARSPLQPLALTMLADIAHAGPAARSALWEAQAQKLFLAMLDMGYWCGPGLASLAAWVAGATSAEQHHERASAVAVAEDGKGDRSRHQAASETSSNTTQSASNTAAATQLPAVIAESYVHALGCELARPVAVSALTRLFTSATGPLLDMLLPPLVTLVERCAPLALALGGLDAFLLRACTGGDVSQECHAESEGFMRALLLRLVEAKRAVVLKHFLALLKAVFAVQSSALAVGVGQTTARELSKGETEPQGDGSSAVASASRGPRVKHTSTTDKRRSGKNDTSQRILTSSKARPAALALLWDLGTVVPRLAAVHAHDKVLVATAAESLARELAESLADSDVSLPAIAAALRISERTKAG